MRRAMMIVAALLVAGCETCTEPTDVNAGVGIGTGGVSGGVSVGRSCGPGYIALGVGNGFYLGW